MSKYSGIALNVSACFDHCPAPYFSLSLTMECVRECFSNQFTELDDWYRMCKDCNHNCLTCVSSSQCLSCRDNFFLSNQLCVRNCSPNAFPDENRVCRQCYETCQQCSGLFRNSCLTCRLDYFFLRGECLGACPDPYFADPVRQQCVTKCAEEYYYADLRSRTCLPCHASCRTCADQLIN